MSALSGYLVAITCWLVHMLIALTLPATSGIRPFLLFGWTFPSASGQSHWLIGKLVLALVAALLFAPQGWLLRHEARFIRNASE